MINLVRVAAFSYLFLLIPAGNGVYAAPPAGVELRLVASGFSDPVAIRHANDGSRRLFVVERAGVIRIVDAAGQVLGTPFLDISSQVDDNRSEQGLLGLAFAPDYASSGYFYVNYTYDTLPPPDDSDTSDRTRVSRFSVSGNPDVADSGSESIIIEIAQNFWNHNGGDIHFRSDPLADGYLYIGMGDGGGSNDQYDNAQSLDELNGKMLRIDVSGSARNARGTASACGLVVNYSVPADNPFLSDGSACAEIWASGLRNPWRWSFDRLTGDIFIGDVGQNAVEEVNFQPQSSTGGENYGWPCKEGNATGPVSRPLCSPPNPIIAPILDYNQNPGGHCAVTGGYRYRGKIPGMQGLYIYADYCSGQIWYIEHNGSWGAPQLWLDTSLNISSFGEDEQGELYLADLNGGIYRFHLPILWDSFED